MKILMDTTNRFLRKIFLYDWLGKEIGHVEGEDEVLKLLDTLLKKHDVKILDLSSIEAKMEGESRVGILIGVSAVNALNYVLGLKKVSELSFPKDPEGSKFL